MRRLAPAFGRVARRAGWAALGAALVIGCDGREKSDAEKVLHALEQLRAAPNEGKRVPLEVLAATPCSTATICAARDQCASAFRHLVTGVETEARVKAEIDTLERDAGQPGRIGDLSKQLDSAEAELEASRAQIPGCEQAASAMRRAYGI